MISQLLLIVLVMAVLAAVVAPFEALHWWAAQSKQDHHAPVPPAVLAGPDDNRCYIVYFSGVGAVSEVPSDRGEQPLLDAIAQQLDGEQIVSHVYPFSPDNRGLLRGRRSSWWWRILNWLGRRHAGGLAQLLIYFRNVLQFAVSADGRYGPVYSLGVARTVWRELLASGYRPTEKRPIVLLGWSGGAQVALGAAWYLAGAGMPVYMLSLGGVMASDPGLNRIQHLWHLAGTKDHVQQLGGIVFPGRWPWVRGSAWRRAVDEGRVTRIPLGPMRHLGRGSYLSSHSVLADGTTCRQKTIDTIVDQIVAAGLADRCPQPPQPPPPAAARPLLR